MRDFSFLNNMQASKVEQPAKQGKGGKKADERNPTNGADLRLFKNGAVYPSMEAMDKYNLEYNKEKTGNGFDVFSSKNWAQYPSDAQHVVFISATPKTGSRVDLFGSAREVEGELTSVMSQGSKTFGMELAKMLEDVYGETLFTNSRYVDLKIVDEVTMPSLDNIFYLPKMVTKGEHTGTLTTERRENAILNPLAIYAENKEVIPAEVAEEMPMTI